MAGRQRKTSVLSVSLHSSPTPSHLSMKNKTQAEQTDAKQLVTAKSKVKYVKPVQNKVKPVQIPKQKQQELTEVQEKFVEFLNRKQALKLPEVDFSQLIQHENSSLSSSRSENILKLIESKAQSRSGSEQQQSSSMHGSGSDSTESKDTERFEDIRPIADAHIKMLDQLQKQELKLQEVVTSEYENNKPQNAIGKFIDGVNKLPVPDLSVGSDFSGKVDQIGQYLTKEKSRRREQDVLLSIRSLAFEEQIKSHLAFVRSELRSQQTYTADDDRVERLMDLERALITRLSAEKLEMQKLKEKNRQLYVKRSKQIAQLKLQRMSQESIPEVIKTVTEVIQTEVDRSYTDDFENITSNDTSISEVLTKDSISIPEQLPFDESVSLSSSIDDKSLQLLRERLQQLGKKQERQKQDRRVQQLHQYKQIASELVHKRNQKVLQDKRISEEIKKVSEVLDAALQENSGLVPSIAVTPSERSFDGSDKSLPNILPDSSIDSLDKSFVFYNVDQAATEMVRRIGKLALYVDVSQDDIVTLPEVNDELHVKEPPQESPDLTLVIPQKEVVDVVSQQQTVVELQRIHENVENDEDASSVIEYEDDFEDIQESLIKDDAQISPPLIVAVPPEPLSKVSVDIDLFTERLIDDMLNSSVKHFLLKQPSDIQKQVPKLSTKDQLQLQTNRILSEVTFDIKDEILLPYIPTSQDSTSDMLAYDLVKEAIGSIMQKQLQLSLVSQRLMTKEKWIKQLSDTMQLWFDYSKRNGENMDKLLTEDIIKEEKFWLDVKYQEDILISNITEQLFEDMMISAFAIA